MNVVAATTVPVDESVDYGELANVPIYQLARRWKEDNLRFLMQSPLTAILSLKLYFEHNLTDDWHRRAGEFLLGDLAFYFRLSDLRPKNDEWGALIGSLPHGTEAFWQNWFRHQVLLLLDIDEDLLKALYYEYGRHRKKGNLLRLEDLFSAYRELSKQGRFGLADYEKVANYFGD